MRNLHTNISNFGSNSICQGITLIVRNEVVRPLRAVLSALRVRASRLSDDMRGARWQWSTGMFTAFMTAKQPACCFATVKQLERHPGVTTRVTGYRSVA